MTVALTIAGSDSSGGGGVQADIKAFASVDVHGCAVISCTTAQNTQTVRSIFPLPVSVIEEQLAAILSDIDVGAAKTGMLYSGEIVSTVSKALVNQDFPIVVDPVLVATVGDSLHSAGFVENLKKKLIPQADLLTPNVHEASVLAGIEVRNMEEAREACKVIHDMGAKNVLIKGGHIGEDATDILFDGDSYVELSGHRFEDDLHGSGCAFSALISANLARGLEMVESVRRAKRRISIAFQFGYSVGKGAKVVNSHYIPDRFSVWKEMYVAVERLKSTLPTDLVPEVGTNFGYSLPMPCGPEDVCALVGRLTRVGDRLESAGCPDFGGSKHVAQIILAASQFDPMIRSAVNLKYREETLHRCGEAGLTIANFDRSKEPEGVSSMEWGTRQAIMDSGFVPDVIYDEGTRGKEPMIRLLGKSPADVLSKLEKIV
ncbi:MAG: bifunctional hydroxymethylpyrimidine kinase/phosphomethylpyrimidine kinase [Thermoplasmata archaeon]